jgi:hypothetical protein
MTWMPWLGRKKSGLVKKPSVHRSEWELPQEEWQPRPVPVLQPSSRGQLADETEDESSSESENDSEIAPPSANLALTVSPTILANYRINLRAMIASSLQPPFSPPPFVNLDGLPIFPRSCNIRSSLYTQESIETRMHKTRILHRLDHQQIPRAQELSIISFGMRPTPTSNRPSLQLDEEVVPSTFQIRTYSQGLQRWALRPCFEDRVVVWFPEEGTENVMCTRVTGTSLGVAALEISEALDMLAGTIAEDSDVESPSTNSNNSLAFPAGGLPFTT